MRWNSEPMESFILESVGTRRHPRTDTNYNATEGLPSLVATKSRPFNPLKIFELDPNDDIASAPCVPLKMGRRRKPEKGFVFLFL